MSAGPTFLILNLTLFCTTVCGNGIQKASISISEEFSGNMKDFIKSIPDSLHRCMYKKHLLEMKCKGIATGIVQGRANAFMAFFECGIGVCKRAFERPFDSSKPIFQTLEAENFLENNHSKLPETLEDIMKSRDDWIYEHDETFDFLTTTTLSLKDNYVNKLTVYYNKWLYIMKCDNDHLLEAPAYLIILKSGLNTFFAENSKDYPDKDAFFSKVAACYARGYSFMNAFAHYWMPKLKNYAEENPDLEFPDVLFSLLPTWHLTEEDVALINILIAAISRNEYYYPIKTALVRNKRGKEENENDWVVIPYDDSPKCGSWDLNKISTNTPPNHKTYKLFTIAF